MIQLKFYLKIYSPPLTIYMIQKLRNLCISFTTLHDDIVFKNKEDYKKAKKMLQNLINKI